MRKNILLIFILILLSLPSIISLFRPGFFQSDDGEWMIIRFSAFHQALRDGQFPVRFLGRLNYEYGYPVANFLYPGFMYLAEIPKIIGFSFVNSIKIILGLSMVASLAFSFLWLRKFFGKWEAGLGSLFYLYAPYHLFDLYKRGSVGEILALMIVPFIFWQIERKSLFWTAIGIGLLILSHNTLALLFIPILVVYVLISKYLNILISFFLGFSLSAFFWIPAIFDLGYTRFSQTQVSNWQDYFINFDLVGWGTLVIFVLFFLRFGTSLARKKISLCSNDLNHSIKISFFFFFVGTGAIFLSLSQSSLLWQNLPVTFVQFPFRFLSVTILSASFLAACCLSVLSKKLKIITGGALLALLIISSLPFVSPLQFFDKGEGFYTTNEGTTTVQDEYMPKWVKVKPSERFKEKVEIIDGKAEISNLVYNSKKIEFAINSLTDVKIRVNTIYFPGWKAFIDTKESAINYENDMGVMDLSVPKGQHSVKLSFSETSLRLFADIISVLSAIILVGFFVRQPRGLSLG